MPATEEQRTDGARLAHAARRSEPRRVPDQNEKRAHSVLECARLGHGGFVVIQAESRGAMRAALGRPASACRRDASWNPRFTVGKDEIHIDFGFLHASAESAGTGQHGHIPALSFSRSHLIVDKPRDSYDSACGDSTGGHIKRMRLERGLRQRDLAALLGVSVASVRNWETGRCGPSKALATLILWIAGGSRGCGDPH
jgi:DNA-binding transcriptional regulator YiaG